MRRVGDQRRYNAFFGDESEGSQKVVRSGVFGGECPGFQVGLSRVSSGVRRGIEDSGRNETRVIVSCLGPMTLQRQSLDHR